MQWLNNFILELLFASLAAGLLVLLLCVLSPLFRSRYAIGLKQLLWVLLALRLLFVFSYQDTFFTISTAQYDDGGRVYTTSKIMDHSADDPDSTYVTVPENAPEQIDNFQDLKISSSKGYRFSDRMVEFKTDEELGWVLPKEKASLGKKFQLGIFSAISFIRSHVKVIAAVYAAGVVLFVLYHAAATIYYSRKRRKKRIPVSNQEYLEVFENTMERLGIKRRPALYKIEGLASPMAAGILHPCVYIAGEDYSEKELSAIFAHELTHIRHQDLLIKIVFLCANAVHWFNPLIYFMVSRAEKDMEMYCDKTVVAMYDWKERQEYNEVLLSVLKNHSNKVHQEYLSTGFKGGVKEMKERFLNNLDMRKKKEGLVPTLVMAMSIALSFGVFSMEQRVLAEVDSDNARLADALFHMAQKQGEEWPEYRVDEEEYDYADEEERFLEGMPRTYRAGDMAIYDHKPCRVKDEYLIPTFFHDDEGGAFVFYDLVPAEGEILQEPPKVQIFGGNQRIPSYGVVENSWSGTEVEQTGQEPEGENAFFAQQCAKGEENPLFYVKSWRDFDFEAIHMFFPAGQEPDVVNVEDCVLNEDGTLRYEGVPHTNVFRGADIDSRLSVVKFALTEHYTIGVYEDDLYYEELVHPYYRGYRVTCYWANPTGLQSCTYYIVLRTQTTIHDDALAREREQKQQVQ